MQCLILPEKAISDGFKRCPCSQIPEGKNLFKFHILERLLDLRFDDLSLAELRQEQSAQVLDVFAILIYDLHEIPDQLNLHIKGSGRKLFYVYQKLFDIVLSTYECAPRFPVLLLVVQSNCPSDRGSGSVRESRTHNHKEISEPEVSTKTPLVLLLLDSLKKEHLIVKQLLRMK